MHGGENSAMRRSTIFFGYSRSAARPGPWYGWVHANWIVSHATLASSIGSRQEGKVKDE